MSRPDAETDSSVQKLGHGPESYASTDPDPELQFSDKESESNYNCNCSHAAELKRDSHGFPLVPQPSSFKDDPLVSQTSIKTIRINHIVF